VRTEKRIQLGAPRIFQIARAGRCGACDQWKSLLSACLDFNVAGDEAQSFHVPRWASSNWKSRAPPWNHNPAPECLLGSGSP